jgi:hypothetical protein
MIQSTCRTGIQGRRIAVQDGLMPEPERLKLWSVLNLAGFTRTEVARPDTAEHRHWATGIAMDRLPAMPPRPGWLAVFDGELLHAGRPPNRNCYMPRFTLALKLERIHG